MKKGIIAAFGITMLVMMFNTNIYANTVEGKPENVKEIEADENEKSFDYLQSTDEYISISRNYANLKEQNTTFNSRQLLLGDVNKDTNVTISIYNQNAGKYSVEPSVTYTIEVSTTKGFEQLIELPEGNNKIRIDYINKADKKNSHIVFYITI